uniref:DNA polymerase III subunit alpha n=1 Tax=Methanosphaera sp. TaxID=2666342 RepID=UPI0025E678A3
MAKIHIHTKYSLLDAIIEPEQLVKTIKKQDGDKAALCVTEHGNLYSDVEIYKLCKKHNVKYLMGCEMYICDDVNVKSKDSKYSHLVVIAKNETGRLNLNKLVSESCKYKYYGKPRIDFNMLINYKEGLIILSACMVGEIQKALYNGNYEKAKSIAIKYKNNFHDDYYLEYQSHSDTIQQMLNKQVVDLAKELNIPFVVTTDAHYLTLNEQKYHSIFVQIGQAREVGETYNDCYVQSNDEILSICKSTTREDNILAIHNSNEIAEKCNVELPLSDPIMQHSKIPENFNSEIDYLKSLCINGWYSKKINQKQNKEDYKKRLAYEINAIKEMGFEWYFLFVHSYANSVKRRGIARGSAGGSLVCYLANITDIDPIEFKLYFERFIDVGALDLLKKNLITKGELKIPDVDLDFGKQDREKVLQHVINQYGQDKVASLGTFQYIWAKGAIKDIGKVLGIPYEITNEMTSKLDNESIKDVIELGLLDKYKDSYPDLFDYAERLAGLPKSFSAHPCGKIASEQTMTYYNATDINENGEVILQGDMHTAEDLGLVKADFLGLRTVDVIYDTLEMIGKDYEYIAPHNLNFKDKKVLDNFRNGNTAGVFQFESSGMRDTLKKIECNSIEDLIVANALFRPGSIKYIDNYADRKKGIENFEYLHPDLKPILQNTFGIIVFQEQLIEIGRMAGLSNPDELRKATAKKKISLLDKIKPELFNGLLNRGWEQEQLETLWNVMLDFASYSFNRAHSAAYAIIAYICMFLKTYHPKEFLCAWINSVSNKTEKVAECIEEVNRIKIPVYLGKYDNCSSDCKVYNDGIMIGTKTIKYCNKELASELMNLHKTKSFIELLDEIKNTSMNSRQLTALIGLGYFSDYGHNEKLLKSVELYNGVKDKPKGSKSLKTILPSLRTCSQIKKDKIEQYSKFGLTEYIVKKYANKETPKQYSQIDNIGLLNELISIIPNKPMSAINQVKFDMEYLQYTTYKNSKIETNIY